MEDHQVFTQAQLGVRRLDTDPGRLRGGWRLGSLRTCQVSPDGRRARSSAGLLTSDQIR